MKRIQTKKENKKLEKSVRLVLQKLRGKKVSKAGLVQERVVFILTMKTIWINYKIIVFFEMPVRELRI